MFLLKMYGVFGGKVGDFSDGKLWVGDSKIKLYRILILNNNSYLSKKYLKVRF